MANGLGVRHRRLSGAWDRHKTQAVPCPDGRCWLVHDAVLDDMLHVA